MTEFTPPNSQWSEYTKTMQGELGDKAGAAYVDGVKHLANFDPILARHLFVTVAHNAWNPMITHFIKWVEERAMYDIKINQRDGAPIMELANGRYNDIYLTRKICGIADELAGSNTAKQQLLDEYIAQETHGRPFTLVDSGCYGSIIYQLMEHGYNIQPLFFFSRNPHIDSFLTDESVISKMRNVMRGEDIDGFMGALNDSFECCMPKKFQSPESLIKDKDGLIVPVVKKSDGLSQIFSKCFFNGLKCENIMTLEQTMALYYDEFIKARDGKGSVIMTAGSPQWSESTAFLNNFDNLVKKRQQQIKGR